MGPGARKKFGPLMFDCKVFREQIYCYEEGTCDIVETFSARALCPSCPLITPLVHSYFEGVAPRYQLSIRLKRKNCIY